jgi:hypothetical protein
MMRMGIAGIGWPGTSSRMPRSPARCPSPPPPPSNAFPSTSAAIAPTSSPCSLVFTRSNRFDCVIGRHGRFSDHVPLLHSPLSRCVPRTVRTPSRAADETFLPVTCRDDSSCYNGEPAEDLRGEVQTMDARETLSLPLCQRPPPTAPPGEKRLEERRRRP